MPTDPMCECKASQSHHEMQNKPWVKPGKGGQFCHIPMCSCIQFTPIPEDFFEDDELLWGESS